MGAHPLPVIADEERVVASCRAQRDGAFDLLYRNYAAPLREFCRARLGDVSEAEDACHDALLKAYEAFPRFDTGRRVWPWLATIAGRVCIDVQRARRSVSLDDTGNRELVGLVADDPDREVTRRLCSQLLGDAFAGMPDRYRAPVYLREMEGWTYQEIADLEHTSIAAVRSALVRGRKLLSNRVHEMAGSHRLWPLPAFAPLASVRSLRDRLLLRVAPARSEAAGELALPFFGTVPNVAGALLVAAAVGAALLPSGANADADPAARTTFDDVSAVEEPLVTDAVPSAPPPGQPAADSAPAGRPPADPGSPPRQGLELDLGRASGSADGGSDGSRATLNARIEGRVPGDVPVSSERWVSVGCNRSHVERTVCDQADTLPDPG